MSVIPWHRVRIDDSFWNPRLRTLVETTLAGQFRQLHASGRLAPLGIWERGGEPPRTHRFYDSDIAKWLEAVAYAQAWHPDESLRGNAGRVIAGYEAIQAEDGYCNQSFLGHPEKRWTNLRDDHELYCAGHLMEAAVAWHEAVGDDRLLRVAVRSAEHIRRRFGPDGDPGVPGHPEIELALVRLAGATGDARWRELSRLFVDRRGVEPHWFEIEADARGEPRERRRPQRYFQAEKPVREVRTIDGHAVRALYLLAAMTDLAGDDPALAAAAEAWWRNAVERRMYVTGGFGSNSQGEVFTHDFDLPNREAYAETCASIAAMLVARRRLARAPDGRDGDVLERALYNGMLAGWSLDGEHYFYANPLAVQPGIDHFHKGCLPLERHDPSRPDWYGCACCPPNVARVLASLGGFVADADDAGLSIHLPIGCRIAHGGWDLRIAGDYAGTGRTETTVNAAPAGTRELRLRLPSWRAAQELRCNGRPVAWNEENGYAAIRRAWKASDRVDCDFGIAPRRVHADPRVPDDAGRVAIQRGPLIYCLEQCDHEAPLFSLRLPDGEALAEEPCDFAPGVAALAAAGVAGTAASLYAFEEPRATPQRLRFIPFALWANRKAGAMAVWIPRIPAPGTGNPGARRNR